MKLTLRGLLCALVALSAMRGERLVTGQFETKLIPKPLKYTVVLPDGYDALAEPVPLLYFLHGGGGDQSFLSRNKPMLDELWSSGKFIWWRWRRIANA